jgi:hypothetical protein
MAVVCFGRQGMSTSTYCTGKVWFGWPSGAMKAASSASLSLGNVKVAAMSGWQPWIRCDD